MARQNPDSFAIEMKVLSEEHGLKFRRCSKFHFHLKGLFLLNVYPSTGTVYVQGTNGKASYKSLGELLSLAKGEGDLKGVSKVKRVPGRGRRKTLWKEGIRNCFVCGKIFENFLETTLEHKVPLSKGGSNRRDNLALSHDKCNQERGHKLSIAVGDRK